MVFIFCNNSKNDSIYLNYSKNYNSCNKEGIPNDSLIEYFPSFLFNQKVPSILFGDSIVFPLAGRTKEEFIKDLKVLDLKIHELKDTFEYEQDTFSLRLNSYLLFKMNEPILYDHYLGKDIYRLIVLRSFDLPIAITLEKCDNKYVLKSKILNRNIGYPFMKYNSYIKMIDVAGKEIAIFQL